MNKIMKIGMLGLSGLLVLGSPLAFGKGAGKGGGQGGGQDGAGHFRDGGFPPGFNKGEKKGWDGEKTPPGWRHGKKTGWQGAEMPSGISKKRPAAEPPKTGG